MRLLLANKWNSRTKKRDGANKGKRRVIPEPKKGWGKQRKRDGNSRTKKRDEASKQMEFQN